MVPMSNYEFVSTNVRLGVRNGALYGVIVRFCWYKR